jgi:hypothetical protein
MDRSDAEQEGLQLEPQNLTRLIARDEANRAILQHLKLCPLAEQDVADRLRSLELSFWKLTGFMVGSGILGGGTGALLSQLLK